MPPVGFEPTISASERPQSYALDRASTGTGDKPSHTVTRSRGRGGEYKQRYGGSSCQMPLYSLNLIGQTGCKCRWPANEFVPVEVFHCLTQKQMNAVDPKILSL